MKRIFATLVLLGGLALTGTSRAEGVLLAPGDLSDGARATLLSDVATARKTEPDTFESVAALRARMPALDEAKRGRLAAVTPALLGLGQRAVPAMLSELALEGSRGPMSETAWLAWRLGLLEAVGGLRDPRSAAVLMGVLERSPREFLLLRAAASALGKLNTPTVASQLVATSRRGDAARRLAILSGMGHCRRAVVAHRLAEAMSAATRASSVEPREIRHLARALGDVGNAWAWQTPSERASGEEAAVRASAATTLIDAVRSTSDASAMKTLVQAVLVVDDGSTKARIAAARDGATREERARLDELERRVDRNPLH